MNVDVWGYDMVQRYGGYLYHFRTVVARNEYCK